MSVPRRPSSPQLEFAMAGQGEFSLPIAMVVSGLLRHLSGQGPVRLWILDLGLEARARERVDSVCARSARRAVDVRWLQVDASLLRSVRTVGHLVPATYARLLLPALLPDDVQRVVYLDGDMLVLGDLEPLATRDLHGASVAAVPDFLVERVGSSNSPIANLGNRHPEARYFNGGVLIMNLARWRAEGIADRVFAFAIEHEPLTFGDQDALNGVLADWDELPLAYNLQSRFFWLDNASPTDLVDRLRRDHRQLISDAVVLHFSGPRKPWQAWDRHPLAHMWNQALLKSGALSRRELARWAVAFYPQRAVARSTIATVRFARRAFSART